MRKNFVSITFIALALLGMAACTKTENGTEGKGTDDITTQYLAVRISNVKSPATRAGEEFEYGTEKEQAITNVRFYFFNQDGTPFRLSNNANHNWLEKTAADLAPIDGKTHQDGTPDGNVEETTSAVLLIQGNTGASPYALIAVINPATMTADGTNPLLDGSGVAKDLSLSQLRDASLQGRSFNDNGTSFVMTNSVYDNNGTSSCSALTAGKIKTNSQDALANPVEIYVERVNAKVVAQLSGAGTGIPTEGKWGTINYDGGEKPAYLVGTMHDTPVYAVVEDWGLADENGLATIEKNIGEKADWDAWVLGDFIGIDPWTSADYRRCYWEISVPFSASVTGNQKVNHSWNQYTTSLTNNASYMYTLPNTHKTTAGYADCDKNAEPSEFTKLLVKTVLVYNSGSEAAPTWTPASISSYEHVDYLSMDDLKAVIAAEYGKYYTASVGTDGSTVYAQLTKDNISFSTSAQPGNTMSELKDYQVVPCLADNTIRYYTKGVDGSFTAVSTDAAADAAAINSEMDDNVADVRNGGMAYYYTCIRHLAETPDKLGYLGVVRNLVYNVTINSIKGFGTPVYDPEKVIVPVVPSSDATYLAAKINVLSWRVVNQTADLDATN